MMMMRNNWTYRHVLHTHHNIAHENQGRPVYIDVTHGVLTDSACIAQTHTFIVKYS